jgi:hypothetical protein
MGDFFSILFIPWKEVESLLAILGLLCCWKLQDIEVQQGRIKPKDVRDSLRLLALARAKFF